MLVKWSTYFFLCTSFFILCSALYDLKKKRLSKGRSFGSISNPAVPPKIDEYPPHIPTSGLIRTAKIPTVATSRPHIRVNKSTTTGGLQVNANYPKQPVNSTILRTNANFGSYCDSSWNSDQCYNGYCVYLANEKICVDKVIGCSSFSGQSRSICERWRCIYCDIHESGECLAAGPNEECGVHQMESILFWEGCPPRSNMELYDKRRLMASIECRNMVPTKAFKTGNNFRRTISAVEMRPGLCLLVFDKLNCCGDSLRLTSELTNFCPDATNWNDRLQSFKLCPLPF